MIYSSVTEPPTFSEYSAPSSIKEYILVDPIIELAKALRIALTEKLMKDGELQSNEAISLTAVIWGCDKKPRKHLVVDQGLDAFKAKGGGGVFYHRELLPEEMERLRNISFADQWKQGVVAKVLEDNNKPISQERLPKLALAHGYRSGRRRNGGEAPLYATRILSGINQSLKHASQPFRIFHTEDRCVGKNQRIVRFYRFYRMAEEVEENVEGASSG